VKETNIDDTITIAFILDRTDGNLKDILSNKEEKEIYEEKDREDLTGKDRDSHVPPTIQYTIIHY